MLIDSATFYNSSMNKEWNAPKVISNPSKKSRLKKK
jgi:hypothetical protein